MLFQRDEGEIIKNNIDDILDNIFTNCISNDKYEDTVDKIGAICKKLLNVEDDLAINWRNIELLYANRYENLSYLLDIKEIEKILKNIKILDDYEAIKSAIDIDTINEIIVKDVENALRDKYLIDKESVEEFVLEGGQQN